MNKFRRYLLSNVLRSPGEGGGDPDPELTKEYVAKLRKESEGHRLKAAEQQQQREALAAELSKTKADLEAAQTARVSAEKAAIDAKSVADARVISVELRAAAAAAGLIDADDLRLVDASALKLNEKGEVEGTTAIVDALKASKPHLFAAPKTPEPAPTRTSNADPAPPPKNPAPKLATEMTAEEYAAAKAAFTKN